MNAIEKAKQLVTDVFNDPYYPTSVRLLLTLLEENKTSKCYYVPRAQRNLIKMEGIMIITNSSGMYNYYNKSHDKLISFSKQGHKASIQLPDDFICSVLELVNFL